MGAVLTSIDDAAAILGRGGVLVVPTDTVYGLVVRPDADSVDRLFAIKQRPAEKTLQLLMPDAGWMERVARPSKMATAVTDVFWPGPLTVVVPASDAAPRAVVSKGTIGLRVPAHEVALRLLERTGPLAASSANRSGEPTPQQMSEIRATFGDLVVGYIDGGVLGEASGSTVVDLVGPKPRVLREGALSLREIEEAALRGGFEGG